MPLRRYKRYKSPKKPLLFIFCGESNASGYANNTTVPNSELGLRRNVYIYNNNNNTFETLNMGVNNLTAAANESTKHGFELQIANRSIAESVFRNCHIIKTGQGGSTIAMWSAGSYYLSALINRVNIAKNFINFSDYNIVVLYSLGLNDAVLGTMNDTNLWKSLVQEKFTTIRSTIGQGNVPIIMTEFQSMTNGSNNYNLYNTAIQELVAMGTNIHSVNTTGFTLMDASHWDYSGYKKVTNKMLNLIKPIIN